MICGNCGQSFPDGSRFCPYCGRPAESTASASASAPASAPAAESAATQCTVAAAKRRFCNRCGAEMENRARRCPSCKKRHPGLSVKIFAAVALAAVLVSLGGLNLYQYLFAGDAAAEAEARLDEAEALIAEKETELTQKQKELSDGAQEIERLRSRLADQESEIESLERDVLDLEDDVDFWFDAYLEYIDKAVFMDDYVVIVSDDGSGLYHKHGCDLLDLSYFWVYNINAAVQQGYQACWRCCY